MFAPILQFILSRVDDDAESRGASLVEYALLISLIAIVCFVAVSALGETTSSAFSSIDSGLE